MELLNNCQKYATRYYSKLLVAAEKKIIESLFEQSDKAANNDEQRFYYDIVQCCRDRSSDMHGAFSRCLDECYQRFISGEIAAEKLHQQADELSLVNQNKLEEDLAIAVIVSKSNSRYSEALWKLNKRLAVLRGGTAVNDEDNPFGPSMVGEAIQAAVRALKLEGQERLLVYKQLGKLFLIGFEKPLNQLNDQLRSKGILPNLKFLPSRESYAEQAAPPKVLEDPDPTIETTASINNQRQMYDTIRSIQAKLGPRTHTESGVSLKELITDGKGAETFGEMDYALALSVVQQSADISQAMSLNRPISAKQLEKKIVAQLVKQGDEQSRHKMATDDANIVDLVGMIFRYILDDKNLSDTVKSLLSHLHTPYLKLALMDKTFINNYQHSARVLINSLADVGGRWVEDQSDRLVLPKIRMVVETILKGFIDDYTIFDRLLEDFQRFRENVEKRSKMVEKRNTESQLGMERLELSRQQAEAEVVERLEKGQIQQQVAAILQKPWTDFLTFHLLRYGDEGSSWQSALKIVESVVSSAKQKQASDNKEKLYRRQHEVEFNIKEDLLAMGYDLEASKDLLNGLKEAQQLTYHRAVLNHNAAAIVDPKVLNSRVPAVEASRPALAVEHISGNKKSAEIRRQQQREKTVKGASGGKRNKLKEEILSPAEQKKLDVLKDIAFGTWFYFTREDGERIRMKLAWYSRVTSNYMFVNNAGVKQSVMLRAELAMGLVNGKISIATLDKRSFMERALGAVLNKMSPHKTSSEG